MGSFKHMKDELAASRERMQSTPSVVTKYFRYVMQAVTASVEKKASRSSSKPSTTDLGSATELEQVKICNSAKKGA